MRICVVGMGFIGLPTAGLLASAGHSVKGIDTDRQKIERLKRNNFAGIEPDVVQLIESLGSQSQAIDFSCHLTEADLFIICVPTPYNDQVQRPDIGMVSDALESVIPVLSEDSVVVIQSTCPVGTTRKLQQDVYAVTGLSVCFAYLPETAVPGNTIKEMVSNRRLIGIDKPFTQNSATAIFDQFFFESFEIASYEEAEACKLLENTYRLCNLALTFELAEYCRTMGLDDRRVLSLANLHPRVSFLDPGIGGGGHCIPVDPKFLTTQEGNELPLVIDNAFNILTHYESLLIDRIMVFINKNSLERIIWVGLGYKPGVSDYRESPSVTMYRKLIERNASRLTIDLVDPYFPNNTSLIPGASIYQEIKHIADYSGLAVFIFVAFDYEVDKIRQKYGLSNTIIDFRRGTIDILCQPPKF
jgi:UDP-N-acetyl-D-mannosaminuronic acid dehydrogenase